MKDSGGFLCKLYQNSSCSISVCWNVLVSVKLLCLPGIRLTYQSNLQKSYHCQLYNIAQAGEIKERQRVNVSVPECVTSLCWVHAVAYRQWHNFLELLNSKVADCFSPKPTPCWIRMQYCKRSKVKFCQFWHELDPSGSSPHFCLLGQ